MATVVVVLAPTPRVSSMPTLLADVRDPGDQVVQQPAELVGGVARLRHHCSSPSK
jgi:hypothetical protein